MKGKKLCTHAHIKNHKDRLTHMMMMMGLYHVKVDGHIRSRTKNVKKNINTETSHEMKIYRMTKK